MKITTDPSLFQLKQFKIGQKVYLLEKTIWGDFTALMLRKYGNKPKVENGEFVGWVLGYERIDNQKAVVIVYKQTQDNGGDYYAESDLRPFEEMDFIDKELFEI
jgi:hypothetical protein